MVLILHVSRSNIENWNRIRSYFWDMNCIYRYCFTENDVSLSSLFFPRIVYGKKPFLFRSLIRYKRKQHDILRKRWPENNQNFLFLILEKLLLRIRIKIKQKLAFVSMIFINSLIVVFWKKNDWMKIWQNNPASQDRPAGLTVYCIVL